MLCAVSWSAWGGLGCRRSSSPAKPVAPASLVQRGDQVVVEAAAGEFTEGTVLEVVDGIAKVQGLAEGARLSVSTSELYRLGEPHTWPPASPLLVCRTPEGEWTGCRARHLPGREVQTDHGQTFSLDSDQWFIAGDLTSLGLKQRFAELDRRQAFLAQFLGPLTLEREATWKPRGNQAVVAQRGEDWHSARVSEIRKKALRLKWEADGTETELVASLVVPQPRGDHPVVSGELALLRPALAGQPWRRVQVSRGDAREVTVLDETGAEIGRASCRERVCYVV